MSREVRVAALQCALGSTDVFANLMLAFHNPLWVLFYVVAMVFLGLHLYHGAWASVRTLGAAKPSPAPLKRQIVMLLMKDVSKRMEELGFTAELSEAAAEYLAEVGYDAAYGARPMRRLLQRRVENELSKRLLKGELATGDHILVDYDPNAEGESKLTFKNVEQAGIPVELPVNAER